MKGVLLLVFIVLNIFQAASSRHLNKSPEEYLRDAVALEVLNSWLKKCLNLSFEFSTPTALTERKLQVLLETYIEIIASSSRLEVLTVGGEHLRALQILVNRSEELQPSLLKKVLSTSISSLILSGVPYDLVDEATSNPSVSSILKLLAYVSRLSELSSCLKDVVTGVLYFGLQLERGDIEKARTVAEEILNTRSIFLGTILVFTLEYPPPRLRATARPIDISEEVVEKLVYVLSKYDVDIGEFLARYSISELLELFETVGSIEDLELVLRKIDYSNYSSTSINYELLGDIDEDVFKYPLGGDRSSQRTVGGGNLSSNSSVVEIDISVVRYDVDKLVSKIPQRVLASALDTISRATLSLDESKYRQLTRDRDTHHLEVRSKSPEWGTAAVLLAAAVFLGLLSLYVLHRDLSRSSLSSRAASRDMKTNSTASLNPAVELFWSTVTYLAAATKVEILPSETHREIVEKLESRVDSITSAALRKLGKLYELVRFSQDRVQHSLERDLEVLGKILWRVKTSLK
ncbi:MAG: hypothetical protein RMI56_01520 [Sulfolobales archaeon]|nr:hypothetical protein [Sulfolobales archaeon]MDW8082458.1 hypothetical protein [Sulfolobales archaeon]